MSGLTDDGLARIDAAVAAGVEQGQAPGVVAAIACGDQVHVTTAGAATIQADATSDAAPMRRDTLFRIASITKPMTAAVILSLVEDGALDLDAPAERWLPELADRRILRRPDGPLDDVEPASRAFTVRELLTFTWGFGMQGAMFTGGSWPIVDAAGSLGSFGPPNPGAMPDPDTWLAQLGELPLLCAPGERWLYDTGSQVLGVLAARAGGASFPELMAQRLTAPLGMVDTAFHTEEPTRLATQYANRDGRPVAVDPPDGDWSRPQRFADGSGGLVSTVDDVLRFARMLLDGGAGVLTPAAVAEMTADQLGAERRARVWPGFDMLSGRGWGYGLSVHGDGAIGWEGGSGTAWTSVPELDLTVLVFTQRYWDETGPPAVCAQVLDIARTAVR